MTEPIISQDDNRGNLAIDPDAVYYASILAESLVPGGLHEGLVRYFVYGIAPGSFLRHVLENDLLQAVKTADEVNAWALVPIAHWLMDVAPHASHGSPEAVATWMENRQRERRQKVKAS